MSSPMSAEQKTVGILIFPDVEVLDFCGPFEVFSAARLDETRRRETESPFRLLLVAETLLPVTTSGGMVVNPHMDFCSSQPLDLLLVPGGWGTRRLLTSAPHLDWIRRRAAECELLASVCTGSLLLGAAGLLDGRRATTHWKSLDEMERRFPKVQVTRNLHVVEEGALWTSAGISAGIDMALQIVSRVCGEAVARKTAAHMEYPYPENNQRRVRIEEK